jgi:hypothetical protein
MAFTTTGSIVSLTKSQPLSFQPIASSSMAASRFPLKVDADGPDLFGLGKRIEAGQSDRGSTAPQAAYADAGHPKHNVAQHLS